MPGEALERVLEAALAQGAAQQADGSLQRGLRDVHLGPQLLHQLLLGNDSAGVACQKGEQIEHLGLYAQRLPAKRKAPQINTGAFDPLPEIAALCERHACWLHGTGGTVKGVARALKAARPDTRIVVAEPDNSPLITSGIPQPASNAAVPISHPLFRPHPVQGTSPDFIPKLAADAVDARYIDLPMPVNGADAPSSLGSCGPDVRGYGLEGPRRPLR